jgi:ubiquinone/menaquinone biosynthesis C-methylase UbiE
MLDRLRAKPGSDSINAIEGDILRLPFADASLNAVIAVHIFHLVPSRQDAIREAARVLRPDGVLLMGWNDLDAAFPARQAAIQALSVLRQSPMRQKWENHSTFPLDEGWQFAGDKQVFTYQFSQAPKVFADWIERRVWSDLWTLSDEEITVAVTAARQMVETTYGDPNELVAYAGDFHVQAFKPPARQS